MCGSMVDIQSPTAEIRRGKKDRKKDSNHRMKIYMVSLLHRATINNSKVIQYEYTEINTTLKWLLRVKYAVLTVPCFPVSSFQSPRIYLLLFAGGQGEGSRWVVGVEKLRNIAKNTIIHVRVCNACFAYSRRSVQGCPELATAYNWTSMWCTVVNYLVVNYVAKLLWNRLN